jgi:hypothetical protein
MRANHAVFDPIFIQYIIIIGGKQLNCETTKSCHIGFWNLELQEIDAGASPSVCNLSSVVGHVLKEPL